MLIGSIGIYYYFRFISISKKWYKTSLLNIWRTILIWFYAEHQYKKKYISHLKSSELEISVWTVPVSNGNHGFPNQLIVSAKSTNERHKREAQTMSIFWHWKSIEQKNAALIKKKKNLQQQRKKKPAKVFSSFLRTVLTMTFFHSFITTTKRLSAKRLSAGPVTHSQTNENIREIHIEGSRACRASSNVPALNICEGNLVCVEKRDFLVNWAELISLLLLIFSVHLRGFHIT